MANTGLACHALKDLAGVGEIGYGTAVVVTAPSIRDGKLVPLMVAAAQRAPQLPQVPAAPEVLPTWGRDGSQT